jgi:hypothetical protein
MRKAEAVFAVLFLLGPLCVAQSLGIPQTVNVRYSAQISNSPAGSCGCFALQGVSGDAYWHLLKAGSVAGLGLAADAGTEHTNAVGSANYGLTLTTLTAGPRAQFSLHRVQIFGQSLFGFAHGSGSQFPRGNSLVPSANSFALDLGGAADYLIDRRFSLRLAQLDYLRTALPNTTTNWQNNLRIGAGVTFHFGLR